MKEKLTKLKTTVLEELSQCKTEEQLEKFRLQYLSRKGELTTVLKGMKDVPAEERPAIGKMVNEIKQLVQEQFNQRQKEFKQSQLSASLNKGWLDVTIPYKTDIGHIHPITKIQYELEDIFRGLGFQIFDGPLAEDDFHNFTALNIPEHHPAREAQDTFWLSDGNLLRSHTSSVQIRAMQKYKPPLRGIAPGRVFRNEAVDASHEATFYQVEGLYVDKEVSVANLIHVMKVMLREIFQRDVKVRLRPGFFPFVEPGFELDINCLICGGKGCSVCKQSGWVELCPCGLVHPNVLKFCDIDPSEWSGFAFGLGMDRLVMMRYGIDDIRLFHSGDLRFIRQF